MTAKLALCALAVMAFAGSAPSSAMARGPCDFLGGQMRRQCERAEAAERAARNQRAAQAARNERRAQADADRQALYTQRVDAYRQAQYTERTDVYRQAQDAQPASAPRSTADAQWAAPQRQNSEGAPNRRAQAAAPETGSWDGGLTAGELSAVSDRPQDYAQLCLQHDPDACRKIRETIEWLQIDDVLDQYPQWTQATGKTMLAAMHDVCHNLKTVETHGRYCDAMDKMNYAMVSHFGPKDQDLTRCLAVNPTFQASQKVYVDGYGYKTYGEVEHQITGDVLQNVCAFAVDYSTGSSDGPQTLKPYEVTRIGVGILGSMFNVNTLHFRWIKKH